MTGAKPNKTRIISRPDRSGEWVKKAYTEATGLPNALDMLKLEPDAFMLEVSRVASPQPRLHNWTIVPQQEGLFQCTECNATYSLGPKLNAWMIAHKVTYGECVRVLNETEFGCPIPPRLTESPEWWAFRLRDEAITSDRFAEAIEDTWIGLGRPKSQDGYHESQWYSFFAAPQEQIAVCLVALGKWRMP